MTNDELILRHGDLWTEHYRGTRYHFNRKREFWWQVPGTEARLLATGGHEEMVDLLLSLRPEGGSCRITETGAVITKDSEDAEDWQALYVTEYDGGLEFDQVDVHGRAIEPLDLWTSFYDGSRYTYAMEQVWWRNPAEGLRQRATTGLPTPLEQRLRSVKPNGGSFRITEHGKVLTLIDPQPLPRRLKPQYEALTDTQKRLIQVKVEGANMLPVYLGEYMAGFELEEPERLTDPLPADEEAALIGFLSKYDQTIDGVEEDPLDFADDRPEEI